MPENLGTSPDGLPQTNGAVVLFSGGQDSTVCLAWALERFGSVETVGFDYGQRHRIELDQRPVIRRKLAAFNPIWASRLGDDHVLPLPALGAISETSLTRGMDFEVPGSGLPNTFVPGRNLLFLTYAAALGWRRGLGTLVGGMCETDYSGYPDCRHATMQAMAQALTLGLDRAVNIETPLMWHSKAATWDLAEQLGGRPLIELIVEETVTCYDGDRSNRHAWGYGCGNCPACGLRRKGWEEWQSGKT
ncbi:MAG: 7-cyano-7-deazaguanine synthase QueC [Proteobacteria bacterium]|nr:7-cyano-7-deazaguanine synthase QueC [Pseudomonadota bacterium]